MVPNHDCQVLTNSQKLHNLSLSILLNTVTERTLLCLKWLGSQISKLSCLWLHYNYENRSSLDVKHRNRSIYQFIYVQLFIQLLLQLPVENVLRLVKISHEHQFLKQLQMPANITTVNRLSVSIVVNLAFITRDSSQSSVFRLLLLLPLPLPLLILP